MVAPLPNLAASNVGRAGLAGWLKTLAAEVAADGVTANLLPGRIAIGRLAGLDAAAAERSVTSVEQVRVACLATIPAGRYGRPEEFGTVAAFLCSGAAGSVTGTAVPVTEAWCAACQRRLPDRRTASGHKPDCRLSQNCSKPQVPAPLE